ncbi:hypothetical protein N0V83_009328 [Neocucurbitaria cava]|uniref:Uncharacterized protein n=1 Tax=Neocucurbitaria cava TaxID=798079 RepID=A0A9W8Y2I1_9PLEO|nr:hypothetical protein N0V83_009328 [Neocucurbitaria cava]
MAATGSGSSTTPTKNDDPTSRGDSRGFIISGIAIAVIALVAIAAILQNPRSKRRRACPVAQRVNEMPVHAHSPHFNADDASAPASSAVRPQYTMYSTYAEDHPIYGFGLMMMVPTEAHTHAPGRVSASNDDNEDPPGFGSVQHRGFHSGLQRLDASRRQEIAEARESVDTLPRYDNAPSYQAKDDPLESAQRMA